VHCLWRKMCLITLWQRRRAGEWHYMNRWCRFSRQLHYH
jgi:hypothetical protein